MEHTRVYTHYMKQGGAVVGIYSRSGRLKFFYNPSLNWLDWIETWIKKNS